jgi:hypothetical protein
MKIDNIIEKCRKFEIYQQRTISEDYAEIVMYTKEIFKWKTIFDEIFGEPLSPAGIKPTKEDLELTRPFGGLFDEQTLYLQKFDGQKMLVMFWPWQDGKRVTIKIAFLKK